MMKAVDICVVGGCGRVGLPLGIALASRGRSVVLYDIDAAAVGQVNAGAMPYAEEGANLDIALQWAKVAKAELPSRPEVNDTLGWAFYKKGQHSMAVSTLEEAIAKAPNRASYHYHLGVVYAAMAQRDKAEAAFHKSLALDSKSPAAESVKQALAALKG